MKSLIKYIFSLLVFVIFMSLSFINFYPEKLSKSLTSFTIERNQKVYQLIRMKLQCLLSEQALL